MTTYTLYSNGVLEADGYYLPIDGDNPDYRAYLAWLALGNFPTLADASVYIQKLEQAKTNRQQVKDAYQAMLTRLEQIQAAVNPTNVQVIQAVKDLALYQERIMKVLARLV